MVISKQTLLYLSFFLLVFLAPQDLVPAPYYFPDYLADMIDHFKNKSYFGQFLAYIWGEKVFMSFKHIQWHDALYLQHLFTPSGVHLTSLLFVLKLSPKKGKIYHAFEFLLLFSSFLPPGLYALKRIALFRIFVKSNELLLRKKFSSVQIFFFTFALDFILGSYQLSPLSFALSYLFVGTLLILDSKNFLKFIFFLFCAQLLVALVLFKPFYPLAFLAGMFLSFVFALIFPLLLLGLLTYPFLPNFSEYFLRFYTYLISLFQHPFVFKLEIKNHLPYLMLILLLSLKISYRKKFSLLILILILQPNLGVSPEKYSGFYQKKKYPQYVRRSLRDL